MGRRRAIASKLAPLVLAALGAGAPPGCVAIDGGAIELSWVTYCANGQKPGAQRASCSCNARAATLAAVQIVLTAASDGAAADACASGAGCRFDARDQSANTRFAVPPGDYDITLVPLDSSGQVLGGPSCVPDGSEGSCWQTPAPLRRTVTAGDLVSIGSLLIAVPDCPTLAGCDPIGECPATP